MSTRQRLPNRRPLQPVTKPTEPRAVVFWEGPGEPILLTVHGPGGEVAVPMVPKRALLLAQELIEPAVVTETTTAAPGSP